MSSTFTRAKFLIKDPVAAKKGVVRCRLSMLRLAKQGDSGERSLAPFMTDTLCRFYARIDASIQD